MRKWLIINLKYIMTAIFIISIVFSIYHFNKSETYKQTEFLMDTIMTINAIGDKKSINSAFLEIERIDETMSAYNQSSDLYKLNENKSMEMSDEICALIIKCVQYSKLTNGYFDITIKPVMDLWGFNSHPRVPTPVELEETLKLVDFKKIDIEGNTIKLNSRDSDIDSSFGKTEIDLGGVAKGYASDRAKQVLLDLGIKSAFLDLGGNVTVIGDNGGKGWRIGIQDPFAPQGSYFGVIVAKDTSVVTSGGYERNFEKEGKVYHHIIDPATGYPADSGLVSTTIITSDSTIADILSTAFFVMGKDKAISLLPQFDGVNVVLVDKDKNVYSTIDINIVDKEYKLLPIN